MAASQRARPRVPAPQRSILPSVPGIPAWAAIALAAGSTMLGFLIDGLGGETYPTGTFSALYVLGCVLAVCAVRMRGLFTTMVLPPLLLFVAVPLACQLLGGRATTSIKDVLMNLIIPLVERFPTMMLATVLVLLIGGIRIAVAKRAPATARPAPAERRPRTDRKPRTERTPERKPVKRRRPEPAAEAADATRRRPRRATAVLDDPATEVDMASPARRQPRDPKRAPAAARTREPRAARTAREPEPARVPRRRGDAPPHPQPTVRYRDRADSTRTERRRPDNG
ncbi:DUF6542 domain-containing protein [Nocardia sp. NPDC059177]|uniref:DUF6542 domain-containing protein n=1 Tax=Nocardia sp. NPDC059177 TaxID=3346759 RepID=UPI0036BC8A8B